MNSSGAIMWSGVEFQPDLQNLRKPVRLGVILLTSSGDGVLLGRQPFLSRIPPEFEGVSQMSVELAANWVDSMWKDILESERQDPFARLSERWRWNLYLVHPSRIPRASETEDLLALGAKLYQKWVGEPFPMRALHRKPRRVPTVHRHRHAPVVSPDVPPAWLISENMRRRSTMALAAHA
jgi:hypothetical protein